MKKIPSIQEQKISAIALESFFAARNACTGIESSYIEKFDRGEIDDGDMELVSGFAEELRKSIFEEEKRLLKHFLGEPWGKASLYESQA